MQYVPAWIPCIRFKKHLIEGKRAAEVAFTVPYEKVQRERVCGNSVVYITRTNHIEFAGNGDSEALFHEGTTG